MARMIPNITPEAIENAAEGEVYRQLRDQLPPGWTVRFNFAFCWYRGRTLREAEVDFIVLAPGRGLMILEVKGSYGFECRAGQWFRIKEDGTREEARNPFQQATETRHELVERIMNKLFDRTKRDFPGIWGHAVVYPNAKVKGALPASIEPTVIITYGDMRDLLGRLEAAFDAWGHAVAGQAFTRAYVDRLVGFFSEESTLVPVLAATVDGDNRRIDDITRLQFSAFRGILGNLRVHVRGPAGSGKTILAAWAAQALGEKDARVLLLCYNRVLAAWIDRDVDDRRRFETRNFHSVCREVILRAGLEFKPPPLDEDGHEFWTRVAPALMCEALENLPAGAFERYDAILVDEGQDFHQDWWLPVQLLLRDPDHGRLCIFSDPEQTGVYGRGQALPAPLTDYQLLENCRNTREIAAYCGAILDVPFACFPHCPTGAEPVILQVTENPQERAALVRKVVVDFLEEEFAPSRIAVLSPWKRTNVASAVKFLPVINNKPLDGDDTKVGLWMRNQLIWASTIRAFKGLEADCVVLADAPPLNTLGFSAADLYVAASRAKHRLVIAPTSDEAAIQCQVWAETTKRLKGRTRAE